MSEIQVASRYAKALIDWAQEQKEVEAVKVSIECFLRVCKSNPIFRALLKNPIISLDKKLKITHSIFIDRVHPIMLSFFNTIIMKGRSKVLYPAAKEFLNEYNRRHNIVKATVTSAISLNAENKEKIKHLVRKVTNSEVILIEKINPQLIGGFILKIEDKEIDTSILSQLQKMKIGFNKKVAA